MLTENDRNKGWLESVVVWPRRICPTEGDKMLMVLDIYSLPLDLFSALELSALQGEADFHGLWTPMPHDFSDNGGSED